LRLDPASGLGSNVLHGNGLHWPRSRTSAFAGRWLRCGRAHAMRNPRGWLPATAARSRTGRANGRLLNLPGSFDIKVISFWHQL